VKLLKYTTTGSEQCPLDAGSFYSFRQVITWMANTKK